MIWCWERHNLYCNTRSGILLSFPWALSIQLFELRLSSGVQAPGCLMHFWLVCQLLSCIQKRFSIYGSRKLRRTLHKPCDDKYKYSLTSAYTDCSLSGFRFIRTNYLALQELRLHQWVCVWFVLYLSKRFIPVPELWAYPVRIWIQISRS